MVKQNTIIQHYNINTKTFNRGMFLKEMTWTQEKYHVFGGILITKTANKKLQIIKKRSKRKF